MPLEMRAQSEPYSAALAHDGEAIVCSCECAFCASCAGGMAFVHLNCGGELIPRLLPRASA